MLSDESSSDSETGRFKCRSKKQDEQTKSSNLKVENIRSSGRSRPIENDRYHREFEKKRNIRDRYERHSRERQRYPRHSPIRRRHSRERSSSRRSRERERHRHGGDSMRRSKPRDTSSVSRDKRRRSRSMSLKSSEQCRVPKEEIKPNVSSDIKHSTTSTEHKGKRSEVHKPAPVEPQLKKNDSPIIAEDHDESDASAEVQPGSYYSMIPAVIKEKSEESSEIDSSDDERLRAKLLNLEKEFDKTRKKKLKKKHKAKSSKSSKDRDRDPSTGEVSSTTDIDKINISKPQAEIAEVTSTQKSIQNESIEEGEITSDDDSQNNVEIDPTDLRHKLKRSGHKPNTSNDEKRDMWGPALPPHLERRVKCTSPSIQGPILPLHLQSKSRNIGPSIPDKMRRELAQTKREVIKYESSDEDNCFGPLPAGAEDRWSEAHQRLEERALDMKIKKLDGHSLQNPDVKSREKWMLELPEGKAKYLGLEARSFRAKEGPDMSDRSSWTDTPAEKARKAAGIPREEDSEAAIQREARARHIATRDEEQEQAVKKHKKKHKREESLLDIHQKKLKKKKKKADREEDKKERRPFSRDVDLQVNRFDEAQKKSIIKKAQGLNSRFSRGEAKFL